MSLSGPAVSPPVVPPVAPATAPAVVPPVAPVVPPATPAVDPRDAAFVQRETALQQKAAKLKADEAALAVKAAEVKRGLELDAVIKTNDPLKIMAVAGVTHDAYTAAQLTAIEKAKADQANAAKPVTAADLEAQRKALEQKFQDELTTRETAQRTRAEESRRAAADADARKFEEDAQAYIDAHADDLVLTSVRGSGKDLGQLVAEDAYERAEKDAAGNVIKWPSKLLTIEDAAKKFEAAESLKEAKVAEKRKAKTAVVPETTPPAASGTSSKTAPPQALTSAVGGTQTGAKPVYKSEKERFDAAVAAGEAARRK